MMKGKARKFDREEKYSNKEKRLAMPRQTDVANYH